MSRLMWFGLGVGLTVVVVVQGRRLLQRATPGGILDQATAKGSHWWSQARTLAHDFGLARRQAEVDLRQQAGLATETPDSFAPQLGD
ncbi:MAG: hypothetical protein LBL92_05775 [Propionibacteriaceae bacterium]|jgi:hypothetical protein|nr:hypothetical protein [Propionibacteriaceae bacterium]